MNTNNFCYQGEKWWNDLPESIVAARDFSSSLYYLLYSYIFWLLCNIIVIVVCSYVL